MWKKRGTATLKGSSIGRSSCSKPSEHNGWIPAMASFESLATTFSPPSLPEPPRLSSCGRRWNKMCPASCSSPPCSRMSVPRSSSVSLIRLLVTKVNHRTQAYLGLAQYNATARNNAIWSLGMNTCCLHVLVWCRPLFHGFERVQPRPGALDFARGTHFFCSALVTFLRVQPGLLALVGAALGWKPCFFFSAWLVPYLRCKWLHKSQLTTANFQFTEGVVGKLGSKMCKNWRKNIIFMIKWWSTLCKIEQKCQNMW